MPEAQLVTWIREKSMAIRPDLDERARRHSTAVESRSLWWGRVASVALAIEVSDRTEPFAQG